jgi:twitching motility protein PilT
MRLGKAFRFIVSQRFLPNKGGSRRVAAVEILKSTVRTREYIEKGEAEGKTLLDAMRDGTTEGNAALRRRNRKAGSGRGRRVRDEHVPHATNAGNLRLGMADFLEEGVTGTPSAGSSGSTEIEIER